MPSDERDFCMSCLRNKASSSHYYLGMGTMGPSAGEGLTESNHLGMSLLVTSTASLLLYQWLLICLTQPSDQVLWVQKSKITTVRIAVFLMYSCFCVYSILSSFLIFHPI